MLCNKGSKLFGHDFGRDGFAIVFSEISGDLTTDMDKLSTIWNKSCSGLGLERQEGVGIYNAHVSIYSLYSSICTRKEEFGCDKLLNSKDDAIFHSHTDCCPKRRFSYGISQDELMYPALSTAL